MPVEPFPLIEIAGPPRERGLQYGARAAERIAVSEEIYVDAMGRRGFPWAEVKRLARDFVPSIEACEPDYLEEMHGIAEGAGADLETVVVVNARSEIFNGRKPGAVLPPDEGCTSAVALPAATRDGRLIHGQNWDFNASCVRSSIVLKIEPEDGPSILTFVEAGGLARSGINSAGISVTANNLESDHDQGRTGMPLSMIRRRILSAPNLAKALGAVTSAPRAVSNNMTVASAAGEAVNLETTPDEVFPLWPDADGLFVHSNHFKSEAARAKLVDRGILGGSPCTLYRDRRVEAHLRPHLGALTIEHFKEAFRDDFGAPYAVCRPPIVSRHGYKSASVATVIFDPAGGILWACPAPYESDVFTEYRLTETADSLRAAE